MNELLQQRLELLKMEIAPDGAWIEIGVVAGRRFRQAYWRAQDRIFIGKRNGQKCRRSYIGEEGSPKHQKALEALHNRERLRSLDRQIKLLGDGDIDNIL